MKTGFLGATLGLFALTLGCPNSNTREAPDATSTRDAFTSGDAETTTDAAHSRADAFVVSGRDAGMAGVDAHLAVEDDAYNQPAILIFGSPFEGNTRAAAAYLDAVGAPYTEFSLSHGETFPLLMSEARTCGVDLGSSFPMPAIRWPGAAVPENFTFGWSETVARAHGY